MESKSREQFEAWFLKKSEEMLNDGETHVSVLLQCEKDWKTWKASREALVVELPQRLSPWRSGMGYTLIPNDNGDAYHCDDILIKLRAAGITVKGEGDE